MENEKDRKIETNMMENSNISTRINYKKYGNK
jgi:hypothetical protein